MKTIVIKDGINAETRINFKKEQQFVRFYQMLENSGYQSKLVTTTYLDYDPDKLTFADSSLYISVEDLAKQSSEYHFTKIEQ